MSTWAAFEEAGLETSFLGPPAFLGEGSASAAEISNSANTASPAYAVNSANRLFLNTLGNRPFVFNGLQQMIEN